MTTTKTQYTPRTGVSITGMSDAEFWGREMAIGVDITACHRAAVNECRLGYESILYGDGRMGQLLIRRAVLRLAIAIGNYTNARDYLVDAPTRPGYSPYTHERDARKDADAEELEKAVNREYALPANAEALARVEALIADER